jgi:hypothetical protein
MLNFPTATYIGQTQAFGSKTYEVSSLNPVMWDQKSTPEIFAAAALASEQAAAALLAQAQFATYALARAYVGSATTIYITGEGIAGPFRRRVGDTTSADNGGTMLVTSGGVRFERVFSGAVDLRWFGTTGAGTVNDAAVATAAAAVNGRVKIDHGSSLLRNWQAPDGVTIEGGAELVQDTPGQNTIYVGSSTETDPDNFPERVSFDGMRFGTMPVSTSDDYSAVGFFGAKGGAVNGGNFENTENAVTVSTPDVIYGTAIGSTDTIIQGANFRFVRRWIVQIIQASFTRVIGISAHNDGDNTYSNSGVDTGTNNGGNNCGVRIAGNGRGTILGLSSLRDRAVGSSFQLGQESALLLGVYYENLLQEAISATTGSASRRASHVLVGILARDSGAVGASLRNMNHTFLSGLFDGTGKAAGAGQKHGIDLISQVVGDEVWEITYTGGSGVVPAVGATITQGGVSAVLVSVWATSAYAATAAAAAMPAAGRILVKTKIGGLFIAGALAGITATATVEARCLDGRHRVDGIVTGTGGGGVRVGSCKNLVTVIIDHTLEGYGAEVSGDNNIVLVVAADGLSNGAATVYVSGRNNTIFINESSGRVTGLQVEGPGNVVNGNVAGNVYINAPGTKFNGRIGGRLDISSSGNNTTMTGEVVGVFADASTGGNYSGMTGGMARGSVSTATNSLGQIAVTHGLKQTAAFFGVSLTSATPLVAITKANNSGTSSLVTFYTLAGAPLASTAVAFDWQAAI